MIQITQVDKLRPPDPRLIENLVRVFIDARRDRLQFLIDLHDADDDRAFFANVVLPQNEVWLAESNGAVAGFIAFAPGWVNHLYVAPPFQRSAVGANCSTSPKSTTTRSNSGRSKPTSRRFASTNATGSASSSAPTVQATRQSSPTCGCGGTARHDDGG